MCYVLVRAGSQAHNFGRSVIASLVVALAGQLETARVACIAQPRFPLSTVRTTRLRLSVCLVCAIPPAAAAAAAAAGTTAAALARTTEFFRSFFNFFPFFFVLENNSRVSIRVGQFSAMGISHLSLQTIHLIPFSINLYMHYQYARTGRRVAFPACAARSGAHGSGRASGRLCLSLLRRRSYHGDGLKPNPLFYARRVLCVVFVLFLPNISTPSVRADPSPFH